MTIHKEGYPTIAFTLVFLTVLNILETQLLSTTASDVIVRVFSLTFFLIILQFFRKPSRKAVEDETLIISPADGKVVVIEEVFESEYLKENVMQISVFMSPVNVHINWMPITGQVEYFRHHHGKYLVAWHPKASTENERTTTVIRLEDGTKILVRQIAGALARRIVNYTSEGHTLKQGEEMGFIKFGSRVDVFVPKSSEILVALDQVSKGRQTPLARIPLSGK